MLNAHLLVDLHSHLVPRVDDGSSSIEESLGSLAALYAEGVATLITTPHLLLPRLTTDAAIDRELDRHRREFERLAEAALEVADLPAIGLGQEIWAPEAGSLRRAVRRPGIGLAGTRWMLVEFGFDLEGSHEDVVHQAVSSGRGIIVAHPERYRYLPGVEPLDQMRRWRDAGALLQVNAGSFTGSLWVQQPGLGAAGLGDGPRPAGRHRGHRPSRGPPVRRVAPRGIRGPGRPRRTDARRTGHGRGPG